MRLQLRAAAILIIFLHCVSWLLCQQSIPVVNTVFTIIPQERCPMKILQVNHSVTDYLTHAKIRNQTLNRIDSYRIGWIVLLPNGRPGLTLKKAVRIKDGLKPGEVLNVPAQNIGPISGAKEIRFFIAEATWQGGAWKQDLGEIEGEMLPQKSHPSTHAFDHRDSPGI